MTSQSGKTEIVVLFFIPFSSSFSLFSIHFFSTRTPIEDRSVINLFGISIFKSRKKQKLQIDSRKKNKSKIGHNNQHLDVISIQILCVVQDQKLKRFFFFYIKEHRNGMIRTDSNRKKF